MTSTDETAAMDETSGTDDPDETADRIRDESPSQTALSESNLHTKALCDYVINVAEGCRHGCRFCYVPSTPAVRMDPGGKLAAAGVDDVRSEWGDYVLYRSDVVQNTADDCQRLIGQPQGHGREHGHEHEHQGSWKTTERGQGVVGLSFGTDCYMDRRAGELTGGAVATLVGYNRPVRILTRNPVLLTSMHGEFYSHLPSSLVTIGSSIPALETDDVTVMEPAAPPVEHRFRGLEELRDDAPQLPRFVSMSPTYPTQDDTDLRRLLEQIADRIDPTVVFHEPINPRGGNLEACIQGARAHGRDDLAAGLERITDRDEWRRYALRQLTAVQRAATDVGQRVHLWPDADLLENAPTAAQREWCRAWRERPSPEHVGFGPACDRPYPELPAVETHDQGTLTQYGGSA